MIKEPTEGYEIEGKLQNCDICGITYREYELELQDGAWRCPDCIDDDSEEWQQS